MKLAFVDINREKTPYFLKLRVFFPAGVECVYYTRKKNVLPLVQGAKVKYFPSPASSPAEPLAISDAALSRAIGRKEFLLARKTLAVARDELGMFQRFLNEERPDALFVWNGSDLVPSLAVFLARQRDLPIVFGENGYLPGTTQLDLEGVNHDASITRLVREGRAFAPPDPDRWERALVPLSAVRSKTRSGAAFGLIRWIKRTFGKPKKRYRHALPSDRFPDRIGTLPPRFVFVPFQVVRDSQLLVHSPLVGTDMARMLELVTRALAAIDPSVMVVAKLHPKEHREVQNGYAGLPQRFPNVRFTVAHPMDELLERCAAVVTVNSTVGFEAIVAGKPVVALGHNFYVAPPLVEVVEELPELEDALRRALTQEPDHEKRKIFLRYVGAHFFAPGHFSDSSDRSLQAVADGIVRLLPL